MRRILAALLLLVTLGPNPWQDIRFPRFNADQAIRASPLALDPVGLRAGRLKLLEAWELTSNHSRFGSYSAMTLVGERRFLFAADMGWLTEISLDRGGRVTAARLSPLVAGPGRTRGPKSAHDIEAMTVAPDGEVWLGFEHGEQIWRYDRGLHRALARRAPGEMKEWGTNSGAEAMVRLGNGRFIVLAEMKASKSGKTKGLVFLGDPTREDTRSIRFAYDSEGKGRVTDMALLPDGRVLILHRALSVTGGFASTLAVAHPGEIKRGKRWRSRSLGVLAPPLVNENFEGLAIEPGTGPATGRDAVIWIVSDDNMSGWQRTLLLRLAVEGL